MMRCVRWGQSAYETASDLAMEAEGASRCGMSWELHTAPSPPDPARIDVLVVTSGVRVDARIVAGLRPGAWVVTTTSGYDHIDLLACQTHGVMVARCPLARRDAVVEHALLSLLWLLRRLPALEAASRHGTWSRAALPGLRPRSLHGARVVVVGVGVIGERMGQVLEQHGAVVVEVDPHRALGSRPRLDLDAALADADAVTLHCALSPTSRMLLDASRLGGLRQDCVVVNTARGDVMDVDVAVDRVVAGRLGGLAADVFPREPWPRFAVAADHPALLLTPHAAGYTVGLGSRVAAEVTAALHAKAEGAAPPWPVNAS